jgi:TnsA endonuclease N terminal
VLHGRSRHAESRNELNAFRILAATAHADAWQEQPFSVEYHVNGCKHRYTPDALIVWGSHREVIEIKDDREAEARENQERFRLIGGLLSEHGYSFRIWRRSEICAEPRLTNTNLVLRYRRVEVPATENERIRQLFSSTREVRLSALYDTPGITAPSILRLP